MPAEQRRPRRTCHGWWWPLAGGTGLLALVALAGQVAGISIAPLFRDPIAYLDPEFPGNFVGAFSQLGLLCWWTAVVFAVEGVWLSRDETDDPSRRRRGFLLAAAIGLTWLLLDDMFLFHEVAVRDLLHLDEKPVFAVYLVAAVGVAAAYRDVIARTDSRPLAAVIAFFGLSLVCDVVQPFLQAHWTQETRRLIEDGAKLLGQISIATYIGLIAADSLRERSSADDGSTDSPARDA